MRGSPLTTNEAWRNSKVNNVSSQEKITKLEIVRLAAVFEQMHNQALCSRGGQPAQRAGGICYRMLALDSGIAMAVSAYERRLLSDEFAALREIAVHHWRA